MKFDSAGRVESVLWTMRLADMPRGKNRAQIDRLANGLPPWTAEEAEEAKIKTNVNYLEFSKILADAVRSYYNAFLKPGNFFTVTLDSGRVSKRLRWSKLITRSINRAMKRSRAYFELLRSQFSMTVEHGIGPAFWQDREHWCPQAVGIEDVLIPSDTLLTLENLSHFGLFRQFTAAQLFRMTSGPNVDPAWNMKQVKAALDWVDQQTQKELPYSEMFAPQKVEERWKQDLGFYGTDAVPTIDCWDFYFWSDEAKKSGWRRRMVLDTPAGSELGDGSMPAKNLIGGDHGQWLYNPGDERIYADDIEQIIHFQFGDASRVAPFRYHSVRSLGWLLYSVCHLQNRLRCKLNDAIFESLLQYFRVAGSSDQERAEKIDLHNLGVVPDGVSFVPRDERWKIDGGLAEMGLVQNRGMMQEAAAQYREGRDQGTAGHEKTATEIMAEINAASALVSSLLLQAYQYQKFQYNEIARRFTCKESCDSDVKKFRLEMLTAGVPAEMLDAERWEIEPERILGGGNKTLELAMADKLMAARPLHDPEAQREILYIYDLANTDNPDLAMRLATPDKEAVSSSVHDAQLMLGGLMQGVMFKPVKGQNPIEIIETLLAGFAGFLGKAEARGGTAEANEITGFENIGNTINLYLQVLNEDKGERERVKKYGDVLAKMMKQVKAYEQRLMEQKPQGDKGGLDPETASKVTGDIIVAQTKAKLAAESHRQRTEQREVSHQMQLRQQQEKVNADIAATDLKTAAEIRRGSNEAAAEPKPSE